MVHDIYDAAMKTLFDNPRSVEDLACGFLRVDLGGELDFRTLEQAPSQFVDSDLQQSRADMVWRIRLRMEDSEVDVLLLLEFQSRVDREMVLRINSYTSELYRKLIRGGAKTMPAMLPIVVYDGEPPWSAALGTEEIVPTVRADMPDFQLRQYYFLVDVHRLKVEDLPEDNVFSFRVRVARGAWPEIRADLRRWKDDPAFAADRGLRKAVAALVAREFNRSERAPPDMEPELERFVERGDLGAMEALFDTVFADGMKRGLADGMERGLADGMERQRTMLVRQAARKFGPGAANRLDAFLAGVDDPERLVEIGGLLIDSADSEEFLSRATRSVQLR